MRAEQSKLAVFVNAYFYFDGESYYTDDNIIIFYLKVAADFPKILIFAPLVYKKAVDKENLYRISETRVEFVAIPHYTGRTYSLLKTGFKTIPALYKTLTSLRSKFEMLWQIDCPNPLNPVFNLFCERAKIPMIFFIRQNMAVILKAKHKGLKRYFLVLIARIIDAYNRSLFKKHPCFAVGDRLYAKYKSRDNLVYKIRVNLLEEKDIINPSQLNRKGYSGKLNIIGVGRLEREKGFMYLLQAMGLLVNSYRVNAHLTLIGAGSREGDLGEYIYANSLENYVSMVRFMKHGEDFFSYFQNADLFVQPSLTEGFPKTVFEAMAKGVAVVVTRVGDMPYIIKDGINGLTVEPQSAEAIAKAVLHYRDNPHLLERFALYNLDYIKEFVFEKQKDIILDVIRKL